jgi:hypothetical protein
VIRHDGEPDLIDVDGWRVRKMKCAESDEPTTRSEALADRPPPVTPPSRIRDLTLFTTALALLAAWYVYRGLKYPEHRHHDLLSAVLLLLYAVLAWVRRPIGGKLASSPDSSFRRTMQALALLFVVGFIAFDCVVESRRQAAAEALAQRREVWKQSVERQREAVGLAKKKASDASAKMKVALDAFTKLHRFDPEAFGKWKEAMDEFNAAAKREWEEMDRLTHLRLEAPGRFGRP